MPFLKAAIAKAGRAKEHLDALHTEIRLFIESNPVRIWKQDDVKKGLYIVQLKFPMPSHRISSIASDFILLLRASLDYLNFELSLIETIRDPMFDHRQEGSQFPIFHLMDKKKRETFEKYTRGIPAEAVAIIDSLQPYHAGNLFKDNLLWQIISFAILRSIGEFRSPELTVLFNSLIPFQFCSPRGSTMAT